MTTDLKNARRKKPSGDPGRLPPWSHEAEQGVVGCVLWSPRESVDAMRKSGVAADDFYDLRHQKIVEAVYKLDDARQVVDTITLRSQLKDDGWLDEVGGDEYLARSQDIVPSAANLPYYLGIVQDKSTARRVINTCSDAIGMAHDYKDGVDHMLDRFESAALAVRRKRVETVCIKKVVNGALAVLEEKFNRRGGIRGLPTGFPDLDRVLDGLCPSELIVPAALPSGGKTALSMNFVEHVVLSLKAPVAVFSLEMTSEQLAMRMMSSSARVNLRDIPGMDERAFSNLGRTAAALAASGLHIVEDADSISSIVAEARRLHKEFGVRMVVVDYLQLVLGDKGGRDQNREQEVSGVAGALKRLAKELKIPVVAPSQLNDDGKLRESRAIGQHADVVLMLRGAKAKKNDEDEISGDFADAEPVSVFVAKNRNGPKGVSVPLTFMKCFVKFESAAKIDKDDRPQNG